MRNLYNSFNSPDTGCWAGVVNGLKYYIKDVVRECVEEAISKNESRPTKQYAYSGVELAKYLGCSKSSISRFKQEGKLDGCYKQIDRTIVYDLSKIDEKFKR